MPVCPACGADVEDGAAQCGACAEVMAARAAASADETWVPIFTGRGMEVELVQDDLLRLGIPVERVSDPEDESAALPVGIGTAEQAFYRLVVPPEVYAGQQAQIEEAIALATGRGDPSAMADAEEDYDVQGCPRCRRYFHQAPAAWSVAVAELGWNELNERTAEADALIAGPAPADAGPTPASGS